MASSSARERPYDVVLLGATGFTGGLTAEYLAQAAGGGSGAVRWAIAGRNREKLAAVAERLGVEVDRLHADVDDPASLRELAESASVVATTVGPYIRFGEPLVAACAAAGTDYVDLTGEPEFVDLMYVRHHAAAVESGARLVHCCGFDSIPHDLGAQFTVAQLPEGVPLEVEGFVRAGGRISGGTLDSALTAFSRLRSSARAAGERRQMEGRPANGRRVRGARGVPKRVEGVGWALPLPTIDPQVVLRSARSLERYGPDFSYGHYVAVKRLPVAVGTSAGLVGLVAAAQLGPVRRALTGRLGSGEGPSEEERARSWFNVRFVGAGGGRRVVTEVSGGDPGYTETAKMLGESALCLAQDALPEVAGQTTPAVAMGAALRERLERAGMTFAVLSAER
jgi:saccharopine dehydrogenase (NAD+, L-glutamate forming)